MVPVDSRAYHQWFEIYGSAARSFADGRMRFLVGTGERETWIPQSCGWRRTTLL
jgi:hypothetical protein